MRWRFSALQSPSCNRVDINSLGSRSSITTKGDEHARLTAHPPRRTASRGIHEAAWFHGVPVGQGHRCAGDAGAAIVAERRGITGDTALRLARYFGTNPGFWLNMQRDYELESAAEALGSRLDAEVKPRAA
jgi:hypothetical protein